MKAIAPGKVILTGEHAVVYGRPALVMAVDRFAEATSRREPSGLVTLDLSDLRERHVAPLEDLRALRQALTARYERFLQGDLPIREVLRGPAELFQFALASLFDELRHEPDTGLAFRIRSDIPAGCGMGSSAATVLALLRVAAEELGAHLETERYYRLALEAEKLQHGRPSGVDPYTCLHGGLLRFRRHAAERLRLPDAQALFLVHTGTPDSTTGECVEHVARRRVPEAVWDAFEAVACDLERALRAGDAAAVREHVRRNHRLLVDLGVVPQRVKDFVAQVEAAGGAAKICGAGALEGPGAGIVWVAAESPPLEICRAFGYQWISVRGDDDGTRLC